MVASSCRVAGPSSLRLLSLATLPHTEAVSKALTGRTDYSNQRLFSTSSAHSDHYKTLGVPRGATKAQIKTHFYQLSKKHHPDVSKDANSKALFARMTEAYTVLSNDRERRLYDRSLSGPAHRAHPHTQNQTSTTSNPVHRPRPTSTATHAWQSTRRHPNSSSPYTRNGESRRPDEWFRGYTHPGPQMHRHPGQGAHYEPPRPPEGRTGYVGRTPRERLSEEAERDLEIQRISSSWRALQIIGIIGVGIGLVGGFH